MRRLAALLSGLMVALVAAVSLATPAFADTDTYDSFSADYTVTPAGLLQVRETWVLRFGSGSGRHGFDRHLVTREPFGTTGQDQIYRISDITVSSPDPISTATAVSTNPSDSAREESIRIRIGSADRTIRAVSATYVISYTVEGALRTGAGDHPELYWDATGSKMSTIFNATVQTTVPGGVVATRCYVGPPRSTDPCTSATFSGVTATFTADRIDYGSLMTVSTQMNPGAVSNAQPILVEAGDAAQTRTGYIMLGLGALGTIAIPVLGWLWYRRRGHDERYAGVPPGTVPLSGQANRVVSNDPRIPIPVSFAPPKLPVAYAGFLLDGRYKVEHLTATLIALATSGAIRLDSQTGSSATLVDPARASSTPERLVMDDVFAGSRGTVDLSQAAELAATSRALAAEEERIALSNGWFRRVARGRKSAVSFGMIWLFAWIAISTGLMTSVVFWFLLPLTASLIITLLVVRSKMARGQRTAVGRAWTDQVEGFRTYIATAEADQLRFEEGEDIFSKYLPWAVLFGLADRWVRVCERAIELGRIPAPSGYWYGGSWNPNVILWNLNSLGTSVSSGATPTVSSSGTNFSSDTGFGGGSAFGGGGSFGGGGFSGGGGGGGGGGSW